jgi:glutamate synthase domain-containing protein 3
MEFLVTDSQIDLTSVLADPDPSRTRARKNIAPRNDLPVADTLDDWLFDAALRAVENREPIVLDREIKNTDRTVGARIAGEIARVYGDLGLPRDAIRATFRGSAGQSFGAFCINGLHLTLIGEANDYVGKGMAGGEIVIRLPETARYASNENAILGNTVLYGATGGALFAAGIAGERFAVRNSGAIAVVEGVGDHACEYMTGGTIVVLGHTGRNFGAGMTGGIAFVYDRENKFANRLNAQLVKIERLTRDDEPGLRELIARHAEKTGSVWARGLLDHWDETREQFWKVSAK